MLDYSLASHRHLKIVVNLNRHVSTARGTQPEIFVAAGFACIRQFSPRPMSDKGRFGVDQIELAFAEIAKLSGTGWIRALGEHGSRLISAHETRAALKRKSCIALTLTRDLSDKCA